VVRRLAVVLVVLLIVVVLIAVRLFVHIDVKTDWTSLCNYTATNTTLPPTVDNSFLYPNVTLPPCNDTIDPTAAIHVPLTTWSAYHM